MELLFEGEVVEVKVRKLVSNDKMLRVVIETTDEEAIKLQEAIANYPVFVAVKDTNG